MLRLFCFLIILGLAPVAPAAANTSIGGLVSGQADGWQHSTESIEERKFAGIVRQKLDFSCGAAVFASLFRAGYGAPVTEADVLRGMLNVGDAAVIKERGFSLLDMKNYAKVVGLSAEGYQLPLSGLRDLRVPAIVLLDISGYHHFAILRHIDADHAFLADPALGNRVESIADFAAQWSGVVLVVLGKGYRYDNVIARVAPPLDARDLLGTAPTAPTPAYFAITMFTGVAPGQRL